MAIIDPEGLFEGERLAACSDIAQLYWQRLFLASNTCGRLELSYPSIISKVFKSFRKVPTQPELWEIFEELEKNFLAILYQSEGVWWCQFVTSEKFLPKFKKARDTQTPAPTQEMIDRSRQGYLEWRKRNSFSNQSFRNSSEDFQRRGIGVGVGTGIGVIEEGERKESAPQEIPPEEVSEEIPEGLPSLQYARGLVDQCAIPYDNGMLAVVASAIDAFAKERALPKNRATGELIKIANAARESGDKVNRFWFLDSRYKASRIPNPAAVGMPKDSIKSDEASYAEVVRKKIEEGKHVPEAEQNWLDDYERVMGRKAN